jgi:hypothetical protein
MTPRTLVSPTFLAALLGLVVFGGCAACAQNGKKAPLYATPQAVFDAAKAAAKKGDYRTFHALLTPESGDVVAGSLVFAGMVMKAAANLDKDADLIRKIDATFAKHGLTMAVLDKIKPERPIKGFGKELTAAAKKFARPIKDKGGFVQDMVTVLKMANPFGTATLEAVKIDGDKATGTIVVKQGKKERREPIVFKKIDGGWRIEMPEGGPKKKDRPPPPPGRRP